MSGVRFTVDLEDWFHALYPPVRWGEKRSMLEEPMETLLGLLARHQVRATFYVLGDVAEQSPKLIQTIVKAHHCLGSHGYWHAHYEREGDASDLKTRNLLPFCTGYRSPYWDTTPRPGMSGGAFFRLLPYPLLKAEVNRTKCFWMHPHDLRETVNVEEPIRRKLCRGRPYQKLERLLEEVDFV